jgi:hypothetical protein
VGTDDDERPATDVFQGREVVVRGTFHIKEQVENGRSSGVQRRIEEIK